MVMALLNQNDPGVVYDPVTRLMSRHNLSDDLITATNVHHYLTNDLNRDVTKRKVKPL